MSSNRTIDSLTLNGLSGDSLRTTRNGVPFIFSIDELVELRNSHRPNFLPGVLFGGFIGFIACELAFELARDQGEGSGHGIKILPLSLFDSEYHIFIDFIGVLAGMTIGTLGGFEQDKYRVFECRTLAHTDKLDLLESILEDEDNSLLQ